MKTIEWLNKPIVPGSTYTVPGVLCKVRDMSARAAKRIEQGHLKFAATECGDIAKWMERLIEGKP